MQQYRSGLVPNAHGGESFNDIYLRNTFDSAGINYVKREWYDFLCKLDVQVTKQLIDSSQYPYALDVGCGPCTFFHYLSDICQAMVGIDLSAKMLEIAHRKRSDFLELIQGSALHLPFRNASFDLVLFLRSLSMIRNWKETLIEGKRTMRQNATLCICDFNPELNRSCLHLRDNQNRTLEVPLYLRETTEISEFLQEQDFFDVQVIEVGREIIDRFYDSKLLDELCKDKSVLFVIRARKFI